MADLGGKVVLITGAAHGIGRATAEAFAEKGAVLSLSDIDEEGLKKTATELEEHGAKVLFRGTDVTFDSEVASLVQTTIEDLGSLDVFVMNAGVSVSGPPEALPLDDWRWVVDVNMWAHVYGVRAALPYFKERGSGHLVHVASAGGILGTPGLAAYCMTKFAVFGLAESLAVSLHGTGIGVSVVCPLWVDTDITTRGRVTVDSALGVDEETYRRFSRELLRTAGIPPKKVAEAIVEGVHQRRFLILPHEEVLQYSQIKWSDPESYIGRAAQAMGAQRQFFGEPSGG